VHTGLSKDKTDATRKSRNTSSSWATTKHINAPHNEEDKTLGSRFPQPLVKLFENFQLSLGLAQFTENATELGAPPGRGLTEDAIRKDSAGSPLELPYITELIEEGQITAGVIRPVGKRIAVANDGESTLAKLVRRDGETLIQSLKRLDLAIARTHTDDVFTDEMNRPWAQSAHSRIRRLLQGGQ